MRRHYLNNIQVFLTDGLTHIAEITTWSLVEAVERDLRVGSWRIRFTPSAAVWEAVRDAQYLGIEIIDSDTGWTFSGPAEQRRRRLVNSWLPEEVDIRGWDLMALLQRRQDWPDELDANLYWVNAVGTFPLSVAVTNTLHFNAGPSALPERQIPGLQIIDPDASFGPTISWTSAGLPLLDLWRPWFTGTAWTLRMRTASAVGRRVRQFIPTERRTTTLVVSPDFHSGPVDIIETVASTTDLIGVGSLIDEGTGERTVYRATADEGTWLGLRAENNLRRQSAETAELATEVDTQLAEANATQFIRVEDLVVDGWGIDAQIGDFVHVVYEPNAAPILAPISEARLTATPRDGWRRSVTVGAYTPEPITQLNRKIASLADSVRRYEGAAT